MEARKDPPRIITPNTIPKNVKRVYIPGEVQQLFRKEILAKKGIDIDSTTNDVVTPITREIEEVCESVRDRVVWGIYGSDGELRHITEIGDIGRLTTKDAKSFKTLYMDGLKRQPEVFGSTFQAVRLNRVRDFQTFIDENYVTGAKHHYHDENGKLQEGLVGMATLTRETGMRSHRAWFGKLYVRRAHRGRKLGQDITYHTLDHAAKQRDIAIVSLKVTTTNEAVIPFYKSIGFTEGEIEYDAARIDGYSYDWLTMQLDMDTYREIREKQGLYIHE